MNYFKKAIYRAFYFEMIYSCAMRISSPNNLKLSIAILLLFSAILSAKGLKPQTKELQLNAAKIIEIVIYTTKPNVSEAEHIKNATKAGKFLATLDGFIARNFTRDTEGKWVDLVYWRDMDAAKKAADIFPTIPECLDFMNDINESDMQFMHTSILSNIAN